MRNWPSRLWFYGFLTKTGRPLPGRVTFSDHRRWGDAVVYHRYHRCHPCTIESSTSVATAITDANGRAATRLTLGRDPGTNTVEATVTGLDPETFTATATEQATPHSLTLRR